MKVAVSVVSFSNNPELVTELGKYFPNSEVNTTGRRYTEPELIDALRDADAAIVGLDYINRTVLQNCPSLKVISKHGIGTDKINFDSCKEHGVEVKLQQGTNKRSVSELALSFMLGLMRSGYTSSLELKRGVWNKYHNNGRNLTGKTIGIIGVGNIGKDLVSLLQPFNPEILVNDIRDDAEQKSFYSSYNLREVSKETIYRESDIVTIHTPLTDLTRNMITMRELELIGPESFLINTARAAIVNEADLLLALKNNVIAGAGLDVYTEEPPLNSELLQLENVYCTPHIGGTSKESSLALGLKAIQNLKDYYGIQDGP